MTSEDEPEGTSPNKARPALSEVGEDQVLRKVRRIFNRPAASLIKGIGDDAAVISPPLKTAVSTDLLIEDTHFKLSLTTPRLLGRKAMAVNLSDLAAMAARPEFAFLALAAPPSTSLGFLEELLEGFKEKADEYGVAVAGGDTCRSDKLVLAVTVLGKAEPPAPVYRSGARPGDDLWVTGWLGDSALGLRRLLSLPAPLREQDLEKDPLKWALLKHLDPPARVEEALALAPYASAMMDLSDGILADLPRLLEESSAPLANEPGAVIETAALPLSSGFREHFQVKEAPQNEALALALGGGEDYELLFTASQKKREQVAKIAERLGTPMTRIGKITDTPGLRLLGPGGEELSLPARGFEHFSRE